jgi:hypothetical protein
MNAWVSDIPASLKEPLTDMCRLSPFCGIGQGNWLAIRSLEDNTKCGVYSKDVAYIEELLVYFGRTCSSTMRINFQPVLIPRVSAYSLYVLRILSNWRIVSDNRDPGSSQSNDVYPPSTFVPFPWHHLR